MIGVHKLTGPTGKLLMPGCYIKFLTLGSGASVSFQHTVICYMQVRIISLFAVELDFVVEEYAASKGQFPPRKRRGKKALYIATIEKANSLVSSLVEEGRLDSVGLVVVDEVGASAD